MKIKRNHIIIIALILISVISIVVSLNKYIYLPWETSTTAEEPIEVTSNEHNTVIMEGNMRSVTVLDENNKLKNKVNLGVLKSKYTYWPSAVLDGEHCYLIIDEYNVNSAFLKSEKVVRTTASGKKSNTIFKLNYDIDKHNIFQPKILRLFEKSGNCYAMVANKANNAYAIIHK